MIQTLAPSVFCLAYWLVWSSGKIGLYRFCHIRILNDAEYNHRPAWKYVHVPSFWELPRIVCKILSEYKKWRTSELLSLGLWLYLGTLGLLNFASRWDFRNYWSSQTLLTRKGQLKRNQGHVSIGRKSARKYGRQKDFSKRNRCQVSFGKSASKYGIKSLVVSID